MRKLQQLRGGRSQRATAASMLAGRERRRARSRLCGLLRGLQRLRRLRRRSRSKLQRALSVLYELSRVPCVRSRPHRRNRGSPELQQLSDRRGDLLAHVQLDCVRPSVCTLSTLRAPCRSVARQTTCTRTRCDSSTCHSNKAANPPLRRRSTGTEWTRAACTLRRAWEAPSGNPGHWGCCTTRKGRGHLADTLRTYCTRNTHRGRTDM